MAGRDYLLILDETAEFGHMAIIHTVKSVTVKMRKAMRYKLR